MAIERKSTERDPQSALRRNPERDETAAGAAPDAGNTDHSDALARTQDPLGRIAHDLNNVLQSIRNGADLLRRFESGDPDAGRLIDMVRRNAESAAELTAELLSLAQPEGAAPVPPDAAAGDSPATDASSAEDLLAGLRVLVIEDESLVAMLVEDFLDQLGCRLDGPIADLEEGLDTAMQVDLDLALLDVNVGGRPVYPVAAALRDRGVPIVFMSGDQSVDEPWQHHPIVRKPFALDQLKRALEEAMRGQNG